MFTSKSGETTNGCRGSSGADNKNDEDEEKCSTGSSRQRYTTQKRTGNEARVPNDQDQDNDESISSSNGGGNTTMTTSARQSLAFTIDNFNDKECDAAAQAAKYKSMMERFQSRHRRGASMSKLENNDSAGAKAQTPTRLTSSQSSTPLTTTRSSARGSMTSEDNNVNSLDSETSTNQKVTTYTKNCIKCPFLISI